MSIHDTLAIATTNPVNVPEDKPLLGDSDDESSGRASPRSKNGSQTSLASNSSGRQTPEPTSSTPFYKSKLFWFFLALFLAGIIIGAVCVADANWAFVDAFHDYLSLKMLFFEILGGIGFVSLVTFGIVKYFQEDDVKKQEVTMAVTAEQCAEALQFLEGFLGAKFYKPLESENARTIAELNGLAVNSEWRDLICSVEASNSICFSEKMIGRSPSADIVACRNKVQGKIDIIKAFSKQKGAKYFYVEGGAHFYFDPPSKGDSPYIAYTDGQQERKTFEEHLSLPTLRNEQKIQPNIDNDHWAPHFAAVEAKRERRRKEDNEYFASLRLKEKWPVQRVEEEEKRRAAIWAKNYDSCNTPLVERQKLEARWKAYYEENMAEAIKKEEEKKKEALFKRKVKKILEQKKRIYRFTPQENAEFDVLFPPNRKYTYDDYLLGRRLYYRILIKKDGLWKKFCTQNKYTKKELAAVLHEEFREKDEERRQREQEKARREAEDKKREQAEEKKGEGHTDKGAEARYMIIGMLFSLFGDEILGFCTGDEKKKKNKLRPLYKSLALRLHPDRNQDCLYKSNLCIEILNSLTPDFISTLFENASKEKLSQSEYYRIGITMAPRNQDGAEKFFKDYTKLCSPFFDNRYARQLKEDIRNASSSVASTSAVLSGSSSPLATTLEASASVSASTSNAGFPPQPVNNGVAVVTPVIASASASSSASLASSQSVTSIREFLPPESVTSVSASIASASNATSTSEAQRLEAARKAMGEKLTLLIEKTAELIKIQKKQSVGNTIELADQVCTLFDEYTGLGNQHAELYAYFSALRSQLNAQVGELTRLRQHEKEQKSEQAVHTTTDQQQQLRNKTESSVTPEIISSASASLSASASTSTSVSASAFTSSVTPISEVSLPQPVVSVSASIASASSATSSSVTPLPNQPPKIVKPLAVNDDLPRATPILVYG